MNVRTYGLGSYAIRCNTDTAGDRSEVEKLMQWVYDDLRGLARAQLAGDTPRHTLNPTAVVHEVFIKLIDHDGVDQGSRACPRYLRDNGWKRMGRGPTLAAEILG